MDKYTASQFLDFKKDDSKSVEQAHELTILCHELG